MENNDKSLSMENEVISEKPAGEKKAEISEIDKAKELFEYEMTQVLLCFKNEAKNLKAKDVSEYLAMDIPDAGLEYNAPETEVKGIDFEETSAPAALEMAESEPRVALSVSIPDAPSVSSAKAEPGTFSASVQVDVPSDKAVSVAEINGGFEPKAGVAVPEAGAVELSAVPVPEVKTVTVHRYTDVSAAVPGLAPVKQAEVAVSIPEAKKADFPLLAAKDVSVLVQAEAPASISSDSFALAGADVGEISVSVPDTALPEIPSLVSSDPRVTEYPVIPEKPDFAAYYSDIVETFRAEL